MLVHVIERIHFNQARASREVLSNNGLQILNPEYTVLIQEKHLFCRVETSLLRFKINVGIYIVGLYDCICIKRSEVCVVRTRGIHLWEAARTVKSAKTEQLWCRTTVHLRTAGRDAC